MLNQAVTSDALAAEHRRELLAEAEAYRLAREATHTTARQRVSGIVKKIIGLSPAPRMGASPSSSRRALRAS
jgi:hypothetical protein